MILLFITSLSFAQDVEPKITYKKQTEIDFEGGDIDRSCALDAINDLQSDLESINDNSKSMAGGEGGDVGAEAGGNTTENTNENSKKDQLDASTDAGMDATQAASTTNDNKTENTTENKITTDQSNEQSAEQKATSSASAGLFSGAGASGITENLLIVLGALAFLGYYSENFNLDFNKITNFFNNNLVLVLIVAVLFLTKSN